MPEILMFAEVMPGMPDKADYTEEKLGPDHEAIFQLSTAISEFMCKRTAENGKALHDAFKLAKDQVSVDDVKISVGDAKAGRGLLSIVAKSKDRLLGNARALSEKVAKPFAGFKAAFQDKFKRREDAYKVSEEFDNPLGSGAERSVGGARLVKRPREPTAVWIHPRPNR
jgi:hypothetical protein